MDVSVVGTGIVVNVSAVGMVVMLGILETTLPRSEAVKVVSFKNVNPHDISEEHLFPCSTQMSRAQTFSLLLLF